jgi:hypothetical protein
MKNSTTLLQDLHQKLQAAQLDLEEINNDEALLEFPVTDVPTLPALIQLIEPYYQLWHVAHKFHESHDVWFHGKSSQTLKSCWLMIDSNSCFQVLFANWIPK